MELRAGGCRYAGMESDMLSSPDISAVLFDGLMYQQLCITDSVHRMPIKHQHLRHKSSKRD